MTNNNDNWIFQFNTFEKAVPGGRIYAKRRSHLNRVNQDLLRQTGHIAYESSDFKLSERNSPGTIETAFLDQEGLIYFDGTKDGKLIFQPEQLISHRDQFIKYTSGLNLNASGIAQLIINGLEQGDYYIGQPSSLDSDKYQHASQLGISPSELR